MVGLARLELATSPLSGVRSSHLSYRPVGLDRWRKPTGYWRSQLRWHQTGGAGRDRTGDLLNANQALSQLSYSPVCDSVSRHRLPYFSENYSRPVGYSIPRDGVARARRAAI
jgi:hypothetical protein